MKYLMLLPLLLLQLADPNPKNSTLFEVVHDGGWGYINTNGVLVIPYQFENAQLFSEGLAAVRQGGLYHGSLQRLNGDFAAAQLGEYLVGQQ